jgi:cytoskeletal protein RodZ
VTDAKKRERERGKKKKEKKRKRKNCRLLRQVIKKATVYLNTFISHQNFQQHAETRSNYD